MTEQPGTSKARSYTLRRRAERQGETRRRIVDAAMALHTSIGLLRTTDADVARRAGVTRVTFYRHFPDRVSLFRACTAHGLETMPPPDPAPWAAITDPTERLRVALDDVYSYYRTAGAGLAVIARDIPLLPAELRISPSRGEVLRSLASVLARGFPARGRRRAVGRAAIDHALSPLTWQSLVQQGGLTNQEASDVLVRMVRSAFGLDPC